MVPTMNLTDDDELRLSMQALREHDATHAPSFEAMRQRAVFRARPSRTKRVSLMIVAGLAAACVLVAFALRISTAPITPARDTRVTIHTWRSPTGALLRTPSSALLAPQPILSSVLDDAARLALQQKGGL